MSHSLQERYSALVDAKLRATLVIKDGVICNTRYEGNPKAGAVKIPVRDTEVVAGDYNKASGLAIDTNGTTSYRTLTIDKDKAVNELIDGFDAAAVPDNLVADRLDSAAYSLALQMERDAIAVLEDTGVGGHTTLLETVTLTKDNIYDKIVAARTAMSRAKIPTDRRWLLVHPSVYALLLQDTVHFIRSTQMGDNVVSDGSVGRIAGFTVYEDVNLSDTTNFIAGHPDWFTHVDEWQEPIGLVSLKGSGTYIGASAVQGRKIYAYDVTKAVAVQVSKNAGNIEIGAAAYSVTAPAKSGTPQSTHAAGTGYTAAIAWTPTAASFAASTVYTAKVTLTAADGYEFPANFSATDVTGLPATSGSGKTASEVKVTVKSATSVEIEVKYLATAA